MDKQQLSDNCCSSQNCDCQHHNKSSAIGSKSFKLPFKPYITELYVRPEYRTCPGGRHKYKSAFPSDKVPASLFENSDKPGNFFKWCLDCRNYVNKCKINTKKNKLEKAKQICNEEDENFKPCVCVHHEMVSEYPMHKVPRKMFKTITGESENCSECREYIYSVKDIYREKKIETAKETGKHFCEGCYRQLPYEEMRKNNDEVTKLCLKCGDRFDISNSKNKKRLREIYFNIIKEYIFKNEASCEHCKSIFLQPEEGTKYVVELPTYLKDDKRYVDYKGKTYLASEFLTEFTHLLELRIIDFDHLTEEEQRERGLLLPHEPYEPKIDSVGRLCSEIPMRKEAKKCQCICCKCHTIFTNTRSPRVYYQSPYLLKRVQYVEDIKSNGCSVCGFYDSNPLLKGFIEMDHLDPNTKKYGISNLVGGVGKFDDLVEECKGCRPACRFCHRIHSADQRKEGII